MGARRFFMFALFASLPPIAAAEGQGQEPARARTEAATVRVTSEADRQFGSGVVIAKSKNLSYVLTAQHIVSTAKKVEVKVAGGKTFPAEVLASSAEGDLAVLRLNTVPGVPAPLKLAAAGAKPKTVSSVGWEKGDAPTAVDETLKEKTKVRLKRPGETISVACWEVERKPAPGRSGGPLVDERGLVLGVASGHDGTTGYFIHVDEVHTFLRQNGLQFLTEEE